MRTLHHILFILILVIPFSCTDPLDIEMNNGSDNSIHKKADLAYENYLEDYKIAGKEVFFRYSAYQKYLVWIGHFNSFNLYLNKNQLVLLEELKFNLPPSIFILENEAELKQFEQFYLGEWLIKVRLNFSRDEVDLIFTLPKPINFLRVDDLQTVYIGECECLKESWFDSCENNQFTVCKTTNCKPVKGCGFLGLYDCTGVCRLITPE